MLFGSLVPILCAAKSPWIVPGALSREKLPLSFALFCHANFFEVRLNVVLPGGELSTKHFQHQAFEFNLLCGNQIGFGYQDGVGIVATSIENMREELVAACHPAASNVKYALRLMALIRKST